MTDAKARTLLKDDFTWYGTLMMHMGVADGMVSGACHTTADTMRPALQVNQDFLACTTTLLVFTFSLHIQCLHLCRCQGD